QDGDLFLPTRTIRVAIPEGTGEVRIEGVRGDAEPIPGLTLDPPQQETRHRGTASRPAATALTKREALQLKDKSGHTEPKGFTPPASPIHLGDVGYFRHQRFVEVIYTPVVSQPKRGEALFYGDLDVDIVVDGVEPDAISTDAAPVEPLFE